MGEEEPVSRLQAELQTIQTLMRMGRFDDAVNIAWKGAVREPQSARAIAQLGWSLLGASRMDDALYELNHALALAPTYVWAHQLRARAFHGLGRFDEALEAVQTALRLKPESAESFLVLSFVQRARGEIDAALEAAQRSCTLDPNDERAFEALGRAYAAAGDQAQAEEAYRAALALDPLKPAVIEALGSTLTELDRQDEAAHLFLRAMTVDAGRETSKPKFVKALFRETLFGDLELVVVVAGLAALLLPLPWSAAGPVVLLASAARPLYLRRRRMVAALGASSTKHASIGVRELVETEARRRREHWLARRGVVAGVAVLVVVAVAVARPGPLAARLASSLGVVPALALVLLGVRSWKRLRPPSKGSPPQQPDDTWTYVLLLGIAVLLIGLFGLGDRAAGGAAWRPVFVAAGAMIATASLGRLFVWMVQRSLYRPMPTDAVNDGYRRGGRR